VIILRISASGSSTIPSSGSASRLNSSLRLCPTVPPRLQPCRQLAPPTEPPALLSCPSISLRLSNSNLPASSSAASSACTAERASDSAVLPGRLTCVSDRPSGLSFDRPVSLRLRLDLRFCVTAAVRLAPSPNRSASPSALFISLRREPRFRICLPARIFSACAELRTFQPSPSALPIGLRPQLSFQLCLPAWPLGLRLATGLSALPSYLTADFPAAFLLRRCPQLSLRLSPPVPLRAHPSDSNFRRLLTVASPVPPSDKVSAFALANLQVFPSNFPVQRTTRSSVAKDSRIDRPVHASANPVISVYSTALIRSSANNPNLLNHEQ